MARRKIITIGEPTLRKQCKEVTKFGLRLATLLDDMKETMEYANGVGLAAPQVGILRKITVINTGEGLIELINPIITSKEGLQTGQEGCLSVPGRVGLVTRPEKVTVHAFNRDGKEFDIEGEGLLARAMCHEIDHLKGILYVDIMDKELFEEDTENSEDSEVK